MTNVLDTFLQDLKNNVPGFIAASVTEIKSGISYGALSVDPDFNPELASAYNLEVAKAKLKAISALNLNQKIDDILINLTSQIHIIDISDNGNYFIYLAVSSNDSNLGITRALLSKYKGELSNIFL